jgi:hypothetical protein
VRQASWRETVRSPGGDRHIVQVYRDRGFLVAAVSLWLGESLRRGGGALLACSPASTQEVLRRLREEGIDVDAALRDERLVALDGEGFLRDFMRDGEPHAGLFLSQARDVLDRVRPSVAPGAEVRVWGEMVDILVKRGEPRAAQRLESIWNHLIAEGGIRLLCSYEIDHLAPAAHAGALARACAGHSVLLAEEDEDVFERALDAVLVEEYGEERARSMRAELARDPPLDVRMREAEAILLRLQQADPAAGARVMTSLRRRLGLPEPAAA